MKIICIGDSLTQGFGISNRENWVSLMNKSSEVEFINKGINGDTTSGMLARFHKDVIEEKPQFVIIMGGVNDIIVENSFGAIRANIMSMVHQAYYHRIIPIVGISIKADLSNFRKDWAELTNISILNDKILNHKDWIIKFCGIFNVMFIDFCTEFEVMIQGDYGKYLLDGLHPSKEGHQILANIALDYINAKPFK